MSSVVLTNQSKDGHEMTATFCPEKGMNLLSFKVGNIELIEQSTKNLFEERYAGLGSLIGPHFHRRNPSIIPSVANEAAFPHIERVRANGVNEPFSHGIMRYAPWQANHTQNSLHAKLTGDDEWNGTTIKELQGFNFKTWINADLTPEGLQLKLSIVSDYDALVGLHYYYSLPSGPATVRSLVNEQYRDQEEMKSIPSNWQYNSQKELIFDLENESDYGFTPSGDPTSGDIILDTSTHTLRTHFSCDNQEISWQLYHPKNAAFVCIEPIAAENPRKPQLTVQTLNVLLQASPKN